MGLTSISVVLAVVILNVHLYGSALRPVPRRLRRLLFLHVAPFLRVRLHRATAANENKGTRGAAATASRRMTTIYNAVFLNENDLASHSPRSSSHTFHSTTMTDNHTSSTPNSNSNARQDSPAASVNNTQSAPQSLRECKRLLTELNRMILRPTESNDDDKIIRDWQNVALVMDRCLFYTYLVSTTILTVLTLLVAPLFKTVPTPPEYFRLNITRIWHSCMFSCSWKSLRK